MKKIVLVLMGCLLLAVGCSREVYINKQSEVIREKDKSSDRVIIDRDKQVYDKERKVIREKDRTPDRSSEPASDSGYQSVLD